MNQVGADMVDMVLDPHLCRPLLKDVRTWANWITVFKAMFAIRMDKRERALFAKISGRARPPRHPVLEAWLIIGRRAGKSFAAALVVVFLSCFVIYTNVLGPGERGIVMVVSVDRKQSRVLMRYITAILNSVPMLRDLIVRQDAESIDLSNGITIEITTASYRTIRGYTVVACVCDEISFWRAEDSANPAQEILSAVRPAMATVPGARLICLGTPYRRTGVMYEAYKKFYGHDDADVLVLKADTRTMNSTVPQSVIDRAFEADPANASAEYLAEFRSDVDSFLDRDAIERSIEVGRLERPPQPDLRYFGFCDPSGGAHDAMTLGIAHRYRPKAPRSFQEERDQQQQPVRVVLDVCRGIQPPFDPSSVVKEFAALLRSYRCSTVVGDRYSAEWVVSSFRQQGIQYRHSELSKSELYLESLPLFMTGCVELLDVKRLTMELMGLERRTARSGKDSVDHGPQGHDDFANSCCGALSLCTQRQSEVRVVKLIGF